MKQKNEDLEDKPQKTDTMKEIDFKAETESEYK